MANEVKDYRMIVIFPATSAKQAKTKADAAVKAAGQGAVLKGISTRRETWGAVPDEDEDGE